MASTDITAPLARMHTLIAALPSIGLVHDHDIFDRNDLAPQLVSEISGVRTLRAWWFSGPQMVGRPLVQSAGGWIERTWQYTIYGVEELSDDGSSLVTLRANALAVSDAIDAERNLNNTCHRTQPTQWSIIENRTAFAGVAVSYAQLAKQVVTVSTP